MKKKWMGGPVELVRSGDLPKRFERGNREKNTRLLICVGDVSDRNCFLLRFHFSETPAATASKSEDGFILFVRHVH